MAYTGNVPRYNLCRWVAVCLIGLGLAGCGGDSNGPSSDAQSQTPAAPVQLQSTSVSIADSVQKETRQSITQVNSLVGSSKVGEPLLVPFSNGRGDTLILALDDEQTVRLAGMTASQNTVLSSDTTAHALVRIRLGTVPNGRTVAELDAAIKAAPSYSLLVTAVDTVSSLGKSPMTSEVTIPVANDVILQALTKLAATPANSAPQSAGSTMISLHAISSNRASELTTPYVVVGSKVAGVYISQGGVDVRNTLPLAWSANTSPNPNQNVLLPAASIQTTLTLAGLGGDGIINNFLSGLETTTLQNNGGKAYDLSVFQDSESRIENTKALINNLMSYAVTLIAADPLAPTDCVAKLVTASFRPAEIEALYISPTSDALKNYVSSIAKQSWPSIAEKCLEFDIPTPTVVVEEIIKTIISVPGSVVTGLVGLAGKAAAVVIYSNTPKTTVGICEAPGLVFGYNLVNCAVSFEIDPIVMAPGAETELAIRAIDKQGKPTALSTGLSITSPLNGGTVDIDQSKYKIVALKEGLIGIEIKDTETEVKTNVQVNVVVPTLSPKSQRTTVGGAAVFALKGPAESNIILPNAGMVAQSLHPEIAEINAEGSISVLLGNIAVLGKSAGQATIQVTHPKWPIKPQTTLFVDAATVPPPAVCKFIDLSAIPGGIGLITENCSNPTWEGTVSHTTTIVDGRTITNTITGTHTTIIFQNHPANLVTTWSAVAISGTYTENGNRVTIPFSGSANGTIVWQNN